MNKPFDWMEREFEEARRQLAEIPWWLRPEALLRHRNA